MDLGWQELVIILVMVMIVFVAGLVPATRRGVWLRTQAVKLLRFPPLAARLFGRSLRDEFVVPDYAW